MQINGIEIFDTFAEAFDMQATKIVITAATITWARRAAESMVGFGTSVIGCGAEAGIDCEVTENQTPDNRPGVAVLLFSFNKEELEKQLVRRVSQCVLTCPSTSVFAALDGPKRIALGKSIRYFGDGYQISKRFGEKRYWRIPVMDGEFVCEDTVARQTAVGGGNFIVLAETMQGALEACEAAVQAIRKVPGVIAPFPGGVARSGSKVGSKYKALRASTNESFCPTLRHLPSSEVGKDCSAALELVIDGLTPESVAKAMRVGILATCEVGASRGVRQITGGNYGGKLGRHHFNLPALFT